MPRTKMENYPALLSCKPLHSSYEKLKKISFSSEKFSLGRSPSNSVVIPFLDISRNHCAFTKTHNGWIIEDRSTYGVEVNGHRLGKGKYTKLKHDDIIALEPSREFVYKFSHPNDDFEIPRKRMKLEEPEKKEPQNIDLINNVKLKFQQSQNNEIIIHIKTKIQSTKQMHSASKMLNDQLQLEMDKMQKLEADFVSRIENLKGDKNEVQRQKTLLLEERDAQLASVKQEMGKMIQDLLEKIQQHALAAERIQLQVDQSSEVISALQAQLENAETEKNTLIERLDLTSRQRHKFEAVGQIMNNELQCSICAELFIESTALNCTHTFCKYCIAVWKKNKMDCPICRAPIKSECRSLALDSFIEKMAETLSEESKKKRQDLLKAREELERQLRQPSDASRARRRSESSNSGDDDSSSSVSDGERYARSDQERYAENSFPTDDEWSGRSDDRNDSGSESNMHPHSGSDSRDDRNDSGSESNIHRHSGSDSRDDRNDSGSESNIHRHSGSDSRDDRNDSGSESNIYRHSGSDSRDDRNDSGSESNIHRHSGSDSRDDRNDSGSESNIHRHSGSDSRDDRNDSGSESNIHRHSGSDSRDDRNDSGSESNIHPHSGSDSRDGDTTDGEGHSSGSDAAHQSRSDHRAQRRYRPGARQRNQQGRHVDGLPGSYYGGYGRCFHCKARGHWAHGCPFR